jgi:hypothetical protein
MCNLTLFGFQICMHNPQQAIAERLTEMRRKFTERFNSVMSPYGSVANPRFTLGQKLYYHMLVLLLNNVRFCWERIPPSTTEGGWGAHWKGRVRLGRR